MPTTYKVLGQVNPSATTATTLYTVPSATSTVVSTITICNQASSAATYRIAVLQINSQVEINASIDDWMENNLRDKVMDIIANEDDIDDQISNWMSNNFDITDYNVDDAIESWADNNMDDKIQEAINNLTFSVTVS